MAATLHQCPEAFNFLTLTGTFPVFPPLPLCTLRHLSTHPATQLANAAKAASPKVPGIKGAGFSHEPDWASHGGMGVGGDDL